MFSHALLCPMFHPASMIVLWLSIVASRNNIVIDFISKLTTAMNTRYNATLFILQQEYIQAHMFTKVLVSILQQQLCLHYHKGGC